MQLCGLQIPLHFSPPQPLFATAEPGGQERGILAGANVVMPNLSPANVREKYLLYNGKLCTGFEAAENKRLLEQDIAKIRLHCRFGKGATVRLPVEKTVDTRRLNVVQCKVFL